MGLSEKQLRDMRARVARKSVAKRVKNANSGGKSKAKKKPEKSRAEEMREQMAVFMEKYPKTIALYHNVHYKKAKNYLQAEELMQSVVCEFLRQYYPTVEFFHTKNEGKSATTDQARKKLMGVKRGVSDLLLQHEGKVDFWLELKTPTGAKQREQIEFIKLQRKLGKKAEFANTLNKAVELIEDWINN